MTRVRCVQGHVKCMFNFEAQEKGQMSMNRGARVPASCTRAQRTVLTGLELCAGESFEVMDDGLKHAGWRKVQSLDGTRSGYVPANYIEAEVRTSPSDLRRGPGLCPRVCLLAGVVNPSSLASRYCSVG